MQEWTAYRVAYGCLGLESHKKYSQQCVEAPSNLAGVCSSQGAVIDQDAVLIHIRQQSIKGNTKPRSVSVKAMTANRAFGHAATGGRKKGPAQEPAPQNFQSPSDQKYHRTNRQTLRLRFLLGRQRVLDPGQRDQEQWGQKDAEQHVDPDEGRVKSPHPESRDQGAQRSAKAVFHDSSSMMNGADTILAQCLVIWKLCSNRTRSG